MTISVHCLTLGPMDNLSPMIVDRQTNQAMIVDPAWDSGAIKAFMHQHQLHPVGILLTHSHVDHINALDDILKHDDIPVYIHADEYALSRVTIDNPVLIDDGHSIAFADSQIRVIATPGHTIGSVCYLIEHQLIAGDTLFIDGCGRCDFTESDVDKMFSSLAKLKKLADDTIIYPGHDYGQKSSDTIGHQKQSNPYLLIEDRDFFIKFRMQLQSQYRRIPFAPSSAQEMAAIYRLHQ